MGDDDPLVAPVTVEMDSLAPDGDEHFLSDDHGRWCLILYGGEFLGGCFNLCLFGCVSLCFNLKLYVLVPLSR